MYAVLSSRIEPGFGYMDIQARTGPSAQPGQARPNPNCTGVLPGRPSKVARAPRARALAILLGVGFPPLLDPVGSNKGAGYMGRVQGALGGTLEQVEFF